MRLVLTAVASGLVLLAQPAAALLMLLIALPSLRAKREVALQE